MAAPDQGLVAEVAPAAALSVPLAPALSVA